MTTWADSADRFLAPLFAGGRMPDRRQLIEAYPFGERRYWPYKVWCHRVRLWKHAHSLGLSHARNLPRKVIGSPRRGPPPDDLTGDLFE